MWQPDLAIGAQSGSLLWPLVPGLTATCERMLGLHDARVAIAERAGAAAAGPACGSFMPYCCLLSACARLANNLLVESFVFFKSCILWAAFGLPLSGVPSVYPGPVQFYPILFTCHFAAPQLQRHMPWSGPTEFDVSGFFLVRAASIEV